MAANRIPVIIGGLVLTVLTVKCSEMFTKSGIIPASPQDYIITQNIIMCSFACHRRKCITIYYEDGNCTMGGIGMAPNISGTHVFEKLGYIPNFDYLPINLPTDGSSMHDADFSPSAAFDGDATTWWSSQSDDEYAWWKLDLQDLYWVHIIDVLPRIASDDYLHFHNVEVRVGTTEVLDGDFSEWPLFGFYLGPYTLGEGHVIFTSAEGILGKYISIKKVSNTSPLVIKLMEVKVNVRV